MSFSGLTSRPSRTPRSWRNTPGSPTAYRAAVELYAGELLPEDRYERWAEDRREELRETYLTLLVELARLHEERGEYGPAIVALGRALSGEPVLEEAHLGLMRFYALSGQRRRTLGQYGRLSKALSGELAEPSVEGRRLYEEILAERFPPLVRPPEETPGDKWPCQHGGRHNLPGYLTSFVGREREVVEVKQLLAMTGLLTLTGAGGCGKTRLAVEVARALVSVYPGRVWLVELASLSEPELVPQAVAAALGVREQPGRWLADTSSDRCPAC